MGLTLLSYAPLAICADTNTLPTNEIQKKTAHPGYLNWLQHAEIDLKAAKKLSESPELAGPVVYHIQQCVEKALKAYLVYSNRPVIKTHDLTELLDVCAKVDAEFRSLKNTAAELSPYATASRYPNSRFALPDVETVENTIIKAFDILKLVKKKIQF